MAEYVVTVLLDRIASYLVEDLIEEACSLSNVRYQVEWIEGELRRMQCFLKDAESRQHGDERVRNWVKDVRDVAFDIDDLIEAYSLHRARQHRKGLVMAFKKYGCFLNELILRHEVDKQMKRIKKRIQEIAYSRFTYGIDNLGKGRERERSSSVSKLQERRLFSSYDLEEDVIGLDEDIRTIESQLIRGESGRSVVSVFGLAGIGKTTLAKKVFLSNDVKKHFDCCAFVVVSQDYRAKDALFDLAKKLMGLAKVDLEGKDSEDLLEMVSVFLQERRYLIVLDDIWKCEVWHELKAAFPEKKNGSRIVVTTRFKDVALHADPNNPPREMCLLDDECSWELFSRKLSLGWGDLTSRPPWAEELGRQILKRCGGLPLAIIVMAGLLSRKETSFDEWLKVLQSMHWQLSQDPQQFSDILALSYNDLPYYLKPCFLYFGFFPEDFEIPSRRLKLLWVAEGFVQPRGLEPLEDVAEDYLEELISRSMAQVAKRKSNGKVRACRVHDLLREFSISKAREDCFLEVIHGDIRNTFLSRGRRLAIHYGVLPTSHQNKLKFRSVLCFELQETELRELKKFTLLRVLDLEGILLSRIDSGIGKLIHLRYLGLRGTWLKKLPKSVGNLIKLETLDLRSTLINPIPSQIQKLHSLRNLYFNELQEMTINLSTDATLLNLRTIKGLCISNRTQIERGLDNLTTVRYLALHGELQLHEKSLVEWILNSKNLERLKLHARTAVEDFNATRLAIPELIFPSHNRLYRLHLGGFMRKLYDAEEFPSNLTELSLQDSLLMEDPMPKLEKLLNLRVLKLKQNSYVGRELVCSNGGFPQLQFLKLSFLSVETWRIQEGAFRSLRQLEMIVCRKLKIVPNGLHPVTALRDLKLGFMHYDLESKVQDRIGENWYRVHYVPPI